MSFTALADVAKMAAGSAAEKLIALAYADRHNEESGCAYPSIAWLCEFSSLNRKTVIAAVMRLENAGVLTDTGERKGHTRQIKVYRLNLDRVRELKQSQKRDDTKNGTVPKTVAEQSQKRDTDTVREPVSQKTASSSNKRATPQKENWHRLPANWSPTQPLSENLQTKISVWPPGKVGDELDSFHGWAANAENKRGKGIKLDWDAAWQNWLRRAANDWTPQHGRNARQSDPSTGLRLRDGSDDPIAAMWAEADAEQRAESATSYPQADFRDRISLPSYGG